MLACPRVCSHGFVWTGELCTVATGLHPTYALRYRCPCGKEVRVTCALSLLPVFHAWGTACFAAWEG